MNIIIVNFLARQFVELVFYFPLENQQTAELTELLEAWCSDIPPSFILLREIESPANLPEFYGRTFT